MIVHGTNDSLAPPDMARRLAGRLRDVSSSPVVYAELPRTQHAFDAFTSLRTLYTVRAVERFLTFARGQAMSKPVAVASQTAAMATASSGSGRDASRQSA